MLFLKSLIPLTEAAAEEIVADYAGFLVQGRDVFEKFIEPKKTDNVFLRGLKKGLEYIRNIFGANGMTKQVKAVDNMVDALNTLINATVEGKDIEKREETTAETTKNEETTTEEAKGEDGNTNYSLQTIKALSNALSEYNTNGDITSFVDAVSAENARFGGHPYLTNLIMDYEEDGDADWFAEKIKGVIGEDNEDYAPYTAGGVKFSLATDVASILEEYDTDGVKYGSIHDVADGIESVIAESTEDTTELENILNDFRAAQDDARRWGNRMDSGGEEEFEEALRAYASQGQSKFSLAGAEVGFILENYDDIQDIATAVEAVVNRYPKDSVMLANVLSDYRQNADEEEFMQGLRTFAKYFGDKQERDRSEDKATIEETFGGIWIEDTEEFAKFVSAVNTYPTDENGEGIAKTSDYLYLYYRSIDDRLIPFLSVYLNKEESQEIIKQLKEEYENAKRGNKGVQEHLNRGISRAWNIRGKNSGNISNSSGSSFGRRNGVVGSDILRKGKYFDNPSLYVKVKRTDRGNRVNYSLRELDAPYLDAVERGDMETAQQMVMEAAEKAGYTEKVYHGTRNFGFTTFASRRPSGAIFTSDKPYVSANYAGDGKYASVRAINKGTKLVRNPQDVIDNARSVFNQEWRFATEADKSAVVERVEANAKRMRDEMLSRQVEMPEEMRDDVAWIENIIYDGAEARDNGNEGNELTEMLKRDYDLYKESKGNLRSNDSYEDLTTEQKDYLSFLIGYELGDVAVEIGLSYANAVSEEQMATIDGTSFVDINTLEDMTNETKDIGSYQLYGNLGANPLVVDAEGKEWFALDFNGMRTTDEITEWAKENGYSSVIFKDIYDYGDKSDVKVFFDSADLKSADPVTYDDNGNVIPLSERFNPKKEDIRYSLQDFSRKVGYISYAANNIGVQSCVVIAENKEEYLASLKTAGVKNIDKYRKSTGIYIPVLDTIILDGEHLITEVYAFETLLHEYTHAISRQLEDEITETCKGLDEGLILAYRDEKMAEVYKDDTPNAVLNEIISFFVEKIPFSELYGFYNGHLDVEDLLMEDWQIEAKYEEKYTPIFKALMPVIGKNLEIQKNNYNGKERKAFIIARRYVPENGEVYEGFEQSINGGKPRGYRPSVAGSRIYKANNRGEGTNEEVTSYSLSDIPFFDAEGNAIDMSAISEAKALEMIDGRVRDMMAYDYDKSVVDITNQAKKDRRATRAYYAECVSVRWCRTM